MQGLEEYGRRVIERLLLLVGQGCFGFGAEVGFALLHLGYGVVVALLGCQLLLAGSAQDAEAYQEEGYQHQAGNGVFVHWVLILLMC